MCIRDSLYINSYEEKKVDEIIKKSAGGRAIFEWNGVNGFVDFNTKVSYPMNHESLADVLKFLLDSNDIDGSLIVLKDVQPFLEEPKVVSTLKYISEKIGAGDIETSRCV